MMLRSQYWLSFVFLLILNLDSVEVVAAGENDGDCDDSAPSCEVPVVDPKTCSVIYAPRRSSSPDQHTNDEAREWGVFSLTDRSKGHPVWRYGDVVLQIPDANEELSGLLESVWWDAQETGGHYEGYRTTHSLVPGLGMMSRYTSTDSLQPSNLLPFAPRYDEGGLTRFESPGAGAITHYHNYTWYIREPVSQGHEFVVSSALKIAPSKNVAQDYMPLSIDPEVPVEGYCMDHLRPRKSRIKDTGRGAFATRSIPAGAVVAPVPVLPLSSSSLQTQTRKGTKKAASQATRQLLENYCFGDVNSTLLLYPYGPMVNLINHFSEPNVKLRWSQESERHLSSPISLQEPPLLLMELVATKDIREGEEIYIDYGREWEKAWWEHKKSWTASDIHYAPSYVMDDAIRLLRTQQEQKEHEYPENVFTSCFYKYSDRDESEKSMQQSKSSDKVASFQWKFTKGLYDLKHLRPCEVLRRQEDSKGRSAYAVRMRNRPGLPPEEVIPEKDLHIVTHIPRQAIRFSDRPGSTDTHLSSAFRHWIGLDVFPSAWMDLAPQAMDDL